MNKVTRIFYFTFLLFAVSCSFADEELFVEQSQVDNTNHAAKPSRTDWAFIAGQLVQSYTNNYGTMSGTLAQKIVRLDSASMNVALYNDLKPLNFAVPTTTEAQFFLTNYESAYNNLSVSVNMQSYFNALLQYNANYTMILNSLQNDTFLTTVEKEQLQFVVNYINDTAGLPNDDLWKKRNIVAAVKGFEKSTANALFNVALVAVSNY